MRHNEIPDITYNLTPQHYENIFNVYEKLDNGQLYYMYNLLRKVNFPEELDPNSYNTYITELNDTWALISWKSYNNVILWWLICAINHIENPTIQPQPGTKIKILDIDIVRSILHSLRD